MKIVYFGNGNRGVSCLKALIHEGVDIDCVVTHEEGDKKNWYGSVAEQATKQGYDIHRPENPNDPKFVQFLASRNADLFVLAGYGKIFRRDLIGLPAVVCLNLHAGKVPEYRGSSPMNWVLINGEESFGLSVLTVKPEVDAGDVVLSRSFPIKKTDTIVDLHRIANAEFPNMLVEAIRKIRSDQFRPEPQDMAKAAYWPLRFPDDGFIVWDMETAESVHNKIRALTDPYPGAFTFFGNKRVRLLASKLTQTPYYGDPGIVFKKSDGALLVSATDSCLWITKAEVEPDRQPLSETIKRYDRLATSRGTLLDHYRNVTSP